MLDCFSARKQQVPFAVPWDVSVVSCIHGPNLCPCLRGPKVTIGLALATHCWALEPIPRSFLQCIFEDCTK